MSFCLPSGRERWYFVARRVKDGSVPRLGVADLWGCSRESYLAYLRSAQVKLRRDLLLCVASVMYPYYGLEYYVLFNGKSVVYWIVQLCFAEFVKTLYRVHQSSLVQFGTVRFSDTHIYIHTHTHTHTYIYKILSEISEALSKRKIMGGIFCDLHKACDCVNYSILLYKLEFYGTKCNFLKLIKQYLEGR